MSAISLEPRQSDKAFAGQAGLPTGQSAGRIPLACTAVQILDGFREKKI